MTIKNFIKNMVDIKNVSAPEGLNRRVRAVTSLNILKASLYIFLLLLV